MTYPVGNKVLMPHHFAGIECLHNPVEIDKIYGIEMALNKMRAPISLTSLESLKTSYLSFSNESGYLPWLYNKSLRTITVLAFKVVVLIEAFFPYRYRPASIEWAKNTLIRQMGIDLAKQEVFKEASLVFLRGNEAEQTDYFSRVLKQADENQPLNLIRLSLCVAFLLEKKVPFTPELLAAIRKTCPEDMREALLDFDTPSPSETSPNIGYREHTPELLMAFCETCPQSLRAKLLFSDATSPFESFIKAYFFCLTPELVTTYVEQYIRFFPNKLDQFFNCYRETCFFKMESTQDDVIKALFDSTPAPYYPNFFKKGTSDTQLPIIHSLAKENSEFALERLTLLLTHRKTTSATWGDLFTTNEVVRLTPLEMAIMVGNHNAATLFLQLAPQDIVKRQLSRYLDNQTIFHTICKNFHKFPLSFIEELLNIYKKNGLTPYEKFDEDTPSLLDCYFKDKIHPSSLTDILFILKHCPETPSHLLTTLCTNKSLYEIEETINKSNNNEKLVDILNYLIKAHTSLRSQEDNYSVRLKKTLATIALSCLFPSLRRTEVESLIMQIASDEILNKLMDEITSSLSSAPTLDVLKALQTRKKTIISSDGKRVELTPTEQSTFFLSSHYFRMTWSGDPHSIADESVPLTNEELTSMEKFLNDIQRFHINFEHDCKASNRIVAMGLSACDTLMIDPQRRIGRIDLLKHQTATTGITKFSERVARFKEDGTFDLPVVQKALARTIYEDADIDLPLPSFEEIPADGKTFEQFLEKMYSLGFIQHPFVTTIIDGFELANDEETYVPRFQNADTWRHVVLQNLEIEKAKLVLKRELFKQQTARRERRV